MYPWRRRELPGDFWPAPLLPGCSVARNHPGRERDDLSSYSSRLPQQLLPDAPNNSMKQTSPLAIICTRTSQDSTREENESVTYSKLYRLPGVCISELSCREIYKYPETFTGRMASEHVTSQLLISLFYHTPDGSEGNKASDFKRILFKISFTVIHFKEKMYLTWQRKLSVKFVRLGCL